MDNGHTSQLSLLVKQILKIKIKAEALSEFIEKHQQKKKADSREAQILFDVWESVKYDVDSNEGKEVSDNLPDFRELVYQFPELNHVTAQNSSTTYIIGDDFSWIYRTIDKEAIKLFDENNLINEIDKNLEMSGPFNDHDTSEIKN